MRVFTSVVAHGRQRINGRPIVRLMSDRHHEIGVMRLANGWPPEIREYRSITEDYSIAEVHNRLRVEQRVRAKVLRPMSSGSSQEGEGAVYTPPPVPSQRSRSLAIVIVVVIAVAAVAGVYYLAGFDSSKKQPWLFDGAYGTYSGQTSYLTATVNFTIRVQVINFNSTAVETLSYYVLRYGTHSDTNQSTQWHQLNSSGGIDFTQPSGYTLSRTYSTTRYVSGNTYDCAAYEYTKGRTTLTAYVSNSVDFPVEFTYTSTPTTGTSLSLDLPLVQTNISGL